MQILCSFLLQELVIPESLLYLSGLLITLRNRYICILVEIIQSLEVEDTVRLILTKEVTPYTEVNPAGF